MSHIGLTEYDINISNGFQNGFTSQGIIIVIEIFGILLFVSKLYRVLCVGMNSYNMILFIVKLFYPELICSHL